MNWTALLDKGVSAGAGALLSLAIAYVVVGRDLAFIKGQLSHLLTAVEIVQGLKERYVLLSKDVQEAQKDITAAHTVLRDMKKRRPI